MLENLEKLNPECFLFENYERDWWSLFDIDFKESLNMERVKQCIKDYAIGYCDGSKLAIRPNSNSYAIMSEKNGDRFWFHMEKWTLEEEIGSVNNESKSNI